MGDCPRDFKNSSRSRRGGEFSFWQNTREYRKFSAAASAGCAVKGRIGSSLPMENSSIESPRALLSRRKVSLLYDAWSRNCKAPVKAFPYAWSVFFRLTVQERLDRLPQVFASDIFIVVSLTSHFNQNEVSTERRAVAIHHILFQGRFLAWLNQ